MSTTTRLSGSDGSVESPFLDPRPRAADPEAAWEPRIAVLSMENLFQTAFERIEDPEGLTDESMLDDSQLFESDVPSLGTTDYSLTEIADGNHGQLPDDILTAILTAGESDEIDLTDRVYQQKHPELSGRTLTRKDRALEAWRRIRSRQVEPAIWLRRLIDQLDRHRGPIPREFLLGWIAVESDGKVTRRTALSGGELGYFQIMKEEAERELKLTGKRFARLARDREYSIEKGVQLANRYRQYMLANYSEIPEGSDLFWRLVKARHARSGTLKRVMAELVNAATPITWPAVSAGFGRHHAPQAARGVDKTMEYAAKLKPLADRVPLSVPTISPEFEGEDGPDPSSEQGEDFNSADQEQDDQAALDETVDEEEDEQRLEENQVGGNVPAQTCTTKRINEYDPADSTTVVINTVEFRTGISGITNYKNWKTDASVKHNPRKKPCREVSGIRHLVLHETAADHGHGFNLAAGTTAHMSVLRNADALQFNDLAEMQYHSGDRKDPLNKMNTTAIGIEFVNRGWLSSKADAEGIPAKESDLTAAQRTTYQEASGYLWTFWGDGFNIYRVPVSLDQLEKEVALVQWLVEGLPSTLSGIRGISIYNLFPSIDDRWLQLIAHDEVKDIWTFREQDLPAESERKNQNLFVMSTGYEYLVPGKIQNRSGVISHNAFYARHSDGSFLALYTWLRLKKKKAGSDAFQLCKKLLKDHHIRASLKSKPALKIHIVDVRDANLS